MNFQRFIRSGGDAGRIGRKLRGFTGGTVRTLDLEIFLVQVIWQRATKACDTAYLVLRMGFRPRGRPHPWRPKVIEFEDARGLLRCTIFATDVGMFPLGL